MRQKGKVFSPDAFYLQLTDKDTEGQREKMIHSQVAQLELQSLALNATLVSSRQATGGDWPGLSLSSAYLVPKILP